MSEQYNLTGKIKRIEQPQTFGQNGFTIQPFIVTTDDKYPQTIEFRAAKNAIESLSKFSEGDTVTVSFNVGGRENPTSGRVFNQLTAWKITGEASRSSKPSFDTSDLPNIDDEIGF